MTTTHYIYWKWHNFLQLNNKQNLNNSFLSKQEGLKVSAHLKSIAQKAANQATIKDLDRRPAS